MSNTYILLKDLPYIKAGVEYVSADGFNGVFDKCSFVPNKMGMMHERFAIHIDWIENNPSWFKLKEQVEEKRIEVRDLKIVGGNVYGIILSKEIPPEKYEAVKQAIERELNGETWLQQQERVMSDWFKQQNFGIHIPYGVVKNPDGSLLKADPNFKVTEFDSPPVEKNNKDEFPQYITPPTPEPQDSKEDKCWDIRPNDKVFIDVAYFNEGQIKTVEVSATVKYKVYDKVYVQYFDPHDGQLVARVYESSMLKKQTKEEPKLLFVTEDGVGIFDVNTTVHKVHKTDISYELSNACHVNNNKTYNDKFYFVFSTKEAAKNFILINKPCLSVEDVLRITRTINNNDTKSYLNSELKQLANHKINNEQ